MTKQKEEKLSNLFYSLIEELNKSGKKDGSMKIKNAKFMALSDWDEEKFDKFKKFIFNMSSVNTKNSSWTNFSSSWLSNSFVSEFSAELNGIILDPMIPIIENKIDRKFDKYNEGYSKEIYKYQKETIGASILDDDFEEKYQEKIVELEKIRYIVKILDILGSRMGIEMLEIEGNIVNNLQDIELLFQSEHLINYFRMLIKLESIKTNKSFTEIVNGIEEWSDEQILANLVLPCLNKLSEYILEPWIMAKITDEFKELDLDKLLNETAIKDFTDQIPKKERMNIIKKLKTMHADADKMNESIFKAQALELLIEAGMPLDEFFELINKLKLKYSESKSENDEQDEDDEKAEVNEENIEKYFEEEFERFKNQISIHSEKIKSILNTLKEEENG